MPLRYDTLKNAGIYTGDAGGNPAATLIVPVQREAHRKSYCKDTWEFPVDWNSTLKDRSVLNSKSTTISH